MCPTMNVSNPFQELQRKISSYFASVIDFSLKMKAFGEQEEKNKALYLKHGWFPFPQIPLSAVGFNINEKNIDSVMEQEIENALDEIEDDICKFNPERE